MLKLQMWLQCNFVPDKNSSYNILSENSALLELSQYFKINQFEMRLKIQVWTQQKAPFLSSNTFQAVHVDIIFLYNDCFPLMILRWKINFER